MNKIRPVLMLGFLMLAGAGCAASTPSYTNVAPPTPPGPSAAANGRAVVLIKDKAPSLAGVTSVMLTVSSVAVHSTSTGWVTVASTTKQYDLLKLQSTSATQLMADANLAAGTYDQIRLDISKVDVTASGTTREATLPSKTLKIVGRLTIVAGQTSLAILDFDLDKSLHLTGNGKYILAPVVHLQTKGGAEADIEADESVTVRGGKVETDEDVGVDEKGEARVDFELPAKLKINARGMIERDGNE